MRRFSLFAVVLVAAAVTSGLPAQVSKNREKNKPKEKPPATKPSAAAAAKDADRAKKALKAKLKDFNLDKVPLDEAVAKLDEATETNVFLDRDALVIHEVEPDTPVTVRAREGQTVE